MEDLTPGESQVANLIAEGCTNTQIARRLLVSRHTVDFHLRNIYRKLNIHSRVLLTLYVVQQQRQTEQEPSTEEES